MRSKRQSIKGNQKISTAKLYLCGIVVFGSLFLWLRLFIIYLLPVWFMDLVYGFVFYIASMTEKERKTIESAYV